MNHAYTLLTAAIVTLSAPSIMATNLTHSVACNPTKNICFKVKNVSNKVHEFSIKQSGTEILHLVTSTIRDNLSDLPQTNLTLNPADAQNIAALSLGEAGVAVEYKDVNATLTSLESKTAYHFSCDNYSTKAPITKGLILFSVNPDTKKCTITGP